MTLQIISIIAILSGITLGLFYHKMKTRILLDLIEKNINEFIVTSKYKNTIFCDPFNKFGIKYIYIFLDARLIQITFEDYTTVIKYYDDDKHIMKLHKNLFLSKLCGSNTTTKTDSNILTLL